MKKWLIAAMMSIVLFSASSCSSDVQHGLITLGNETGDSNNIVFSFLDKTPLSMAPLQSVEVEAKYIISLDQTAEPNITQGFYRHVDSDEPQNIFSFIEVGGKRYDLGQVAYGENSIITTNFGKFQFLKSDFNLNSADEAIYQQYKTYGSTYDAIAYYILQNGLPTLLCEIIGVVSFSDSYVNGIILSTDRSMPYTEYTINHIDLADKTLQFTNLTKLLRCDGVYYDEAHGGHGGLFFTYIKPSDLQKINPDDGFVYSLEKGLFVLRYIPIKANLP